MKSNSPGKSEITYIESLEKTSFLELLSTSSSTQFDLDKGNNAYVAEENQKKNFIFIY